MNTNSNIPTEHFDKDHYMNPHNVEYTDTQLQLALSKMLPDRIEIETKETDGQIFQYPVWLCRGGNAEDIRGRDVTSAEWLHVCWLVEQALDKTEWDTYTEVLSSYVVINDTTNRIRFYNFDLAHASWQARATSLAQVKGVEIV